FGLAFVISATTHIARLARAGFVFAREGVFGVVDPSLVPPPGQLALRLARIIERPGAKSGPRLSRALTRLGPAYLKLGQFLATRPDVVGVTMARDLESLQDRLPPFSQAEAEAVIAISLERPVGLAFARFGPSVAENTRNDPDFRVPTVDWDRTTHNVLTMEWIDGIALSDHAGLAAARVDLPDLGRKVIQSFLRHALRDGFFHADMHPGNLFLDETGRLVAVDFGIMGRLGLKERRFLAEVLLGCITRDYRRVAVLHFEAGYVQGL